MSIDDLPNGWNRGGGETNRPLHDGGYYMNYYSRTLPGSNQHVREYLELVVDTSDYTRSDGPRKHHFRLERRKSDDMGSWHEETLATDTVKVADRNNPVCQESAEREINERARELMEKFA